METGPLSSAVKRKHLHGSRGHLNLKLETLESLNPEPELEMLNPKPEICTLNPKPWKTVEP